MCVEVDVTDGNGTNGEQVPVAKVLGDPAQSPPCECYVSSGEGDFEFFRWCALTCYALN